MSESAARLVDHVLPHVPVRQWVLSLPYRQPQCPLPHAGPRRRLHRGRGGEAALRADTIPRGRRGGRHTRDDPHASAAPPSAPGPRCRGRRDAFGCPRRRIADSGRLSSASIQGRVALGRRAGARVWRVGEEPTPRGSSPAPLGTRISMASTSMPMSQCQAGTARGSSSSAASFCARPSVRTGSDCWAMAASCSRSRRPGQTARAICSSSLSSCSKSWRL